MSKQLQCASCFFNHTDINGKQSLLDRYENDLNYVVHFGKLLSHQECRLSHFYLRNKQTYKTTAFILQIIMFFLQQYQEMLKPQ